MRIESFRVVNYKSFADSGEIRLEPGYYLHRDQRTFKRDRPTATSAVKRILQEFVYDLPIEES